jgi:pyruvate formate lyase activating enzyme
MKQAVFWKKLKLDAVQCVLCPHSCVIRDKQRGKCGVRENQNGVLYALTYGKPVSTAVDPIEKKPFYHFLPGSLAYSIACVGCNLSCKFCQNSDISQMPKDKGIVTGTEMAPEEVVEEAIAKGCESISYTYTEPTIFYEYCYDIAKLSRKKGLKNNFVTNGFISPEAIDNIARFLDAANIDLKGFSEDFYRELCDARLQPVLDAIKRYHEKGVFIEITTLIVPGQNDDEAMLRKAAEFIASLDKKIPWHISRFYPQYKMRNLQPTQVATIHKAVEIGRAAGLRYVYAGNVPGDENDNTYCHNCGKLLIGRLGYSITKNNLKGNRCSFCGAEGNFLL